jgi:hypothetical protein
MDLDGDGMVNDITETLGNRFQGKDFENGYEALRDFIMNNENVNVRRFADDGIVTAEEMDALGLKILINGELLSASDAGIDRMSLTYQLSDKTDDTGTKHVAIGEYWRNDEVSSLTAANLFFPYDDGEFYTQKVRDEAIEVSNSTDTYDVYDSGDIAKESINGSAYEAALLESGNLAELKTRYRELMDQLKTIDPDSEKSILMQNRALAIQSKAKQLQLEQRQVNYGNGADQYLMQAFANVMVDSLMNQTAHSNNSSLQSSRRPVDALSFLAANSMYSARNIQSAQSPQQQYMGMMVQLMMVLAMFQFRMPTTSADTY